MVKFNIKSLRDAHNMSQKELQKLSQIRKPTLSAIENSSVKTISMVQINALCKAFDCQISDLMEYIPNPLYDEALALSDKCAEISNRLNKKARYFKKKRNLSEIIDILNK